MTHPLLILSLPSRGQVVLGFSEPLTRESLPGLERLLASTLAGLRRELDAPAFEPGELEYASWVPLSTH